MKDPDYAWGFRMKKRTIIRLKDSTFMPWRTSSMWRTDGLRQKGYLGADRYKNIDICDILMEIWWRGMEMTDVPGTYPLAIRKVGWVPPVWLCAQGRIQPQDESQDLSGRLTILNKQQTSLPLPPDGWRSSVRQGEVRDTNLCSLLLRSDAKCMRFRQRKVNLFTSMRTSPWLPLQ